MERKFIDQAKSLYKEDLTLESMNFYLKDAGAPPDQISDILDEAWAEFVTERTAKYKVINKVVYFIALTLILLTMLAFLVVLPGNNFIIGNVFIFSALGSILVCAFSFYAWMYRNTWKSPYVETNGKVKMQYTFLVAFILPLIIFHYIFSARFNLANDDLLKDSQIETAARVVYGRSIGIRQIVGGARVDYSAITVSFKSQQGDSIIVTKEIPTSQFKNFAKGQELRIIYSRSNPRNVNLLADDESVRNFKHTDQRELEIADLLKLAEINPQQLTAELNKISYGWTLDTAKNVYVNTRFNNELSVRGNQLLFAGPLDNRHTFADSLKKTVGFSQIGKDDTNDLFGTGPKAFENTKFRVELRVIFNEEGSDHSPKAAKAIITRK